MFAHGGAQIQIEQTMAALEKIGITVEPLRWWDAAQSGDVLHYFGRIPNHLLHSAHKKGMKVVLADLLTAQGSRSEARLRAQRIVRRLIARTLPPSMTLAFNWDSYVLADACVALTAWEAHLMAWWFGAPPERTHVVPNGVEAAFLNSQPAKRGPWLVCTATITERKRVVELAQAAVLALTPVWLLGKPYAESDPYAQRLSLLAKAHPELIRYQGATQDRAALAQIYREARGFVLLSSMESLSLSALEAAACQCPLLLSDLPWARTVFEGRAAFCPLFKSSARTAAVLRRFYDAAPTSPIPLRPLGWLEVARQLEKVYLSL